MQCHIDRSLISPLHSSHRRADLRNGGRWATFLWIGCASCVKIGSSRMYRVRKPVEGYMILPALLHWHTGTGCTGVRVGQGYGWLGYFITYISHRPFALPRSCFWDGRESLRISLLFLRRLLVLALGNSRPCVFLCEDPQIICDVLHISMSYQYSHGDKTEG